MQSASKPRGMAKKNFWQSILYNFSWPETQAKIEDASDFYFKETSQ